MVAPAKSLELPAALRNLALRSGLLDRRCILCGTPRAPSELSAQGLCPDCATLLPPRRGGFCLQCGDMRDDGNDNAPPSICSRCLKRQNGLWTPLPWQEFCFYAPYAGVLRACILAYKLRGRLGLGTLLQGLLLAGWRNNAARLETPDAIVPVPLHSKRMRLRGFNQSLELARPLARHLGRPLLPRALRRTRPTIPQFQLELARRAENIQGAFTADVPLRGARVLLVDDIMTTGATLEECARELREAGAARVDVLVLARTART